MSDFRKLKKEYYGRKICVLTEGGTIDFDPGKLKQVVGAENMTYDEYIDTQIRSLGKYRGYFEMCYYEMAMRFKGQIEKITEKNVCFNRIYVSGMYGDGTMFDGREDHVWMDNKGFERFHAGDCLEFSAEVYRYIKTGNGKMMDYSLRNPERIKKIDAYELPSDDDLLMQEIDQIICETCFYREHCYNVFCMRSEKEREMLRQQMFDIMKGGAEFPLIC